MSRTLIRAPWTCVSLASVFAALVLVPRVAGADIAPEVCELANFKRYLGETCVECKSSPKDPDSCREKLAADGMQQRCFTTFGDSSWTEIWCRSKGGVEEAPEVAEPEGEVAGPTPAGPAPEAATAKPASAVQAPAVESANGPTSSPPIATGGCVVARPNSRGALLGVLVIVGVAGLRRRGGVGLARR